MNRPRRIFLSTTAVALFALGASHLEGAEADGARFTRLKKEVKILQPSSAPRTAALNQVLQSGSTIQTGVDSQAELRFGNATLVRLAAKTSLGLGPDARSLNLIRGAILVRAPGNSGGAQVATARVNSDLSGSTSVLEFYPQAYTKLIVLDGTARMFMPRIVGESVLVNSGQLLMFHAKVAAKALPNPVDVDLKRMMATSLLIKGFPPLGSESAIAEGMQKQTKQKSDGALADTNLVIFGRGTLVSLVPPEAEGKKSTPTPSPTPRPSRP